MADSLTNIADRVAALEAAQSGGGDSAVIAAVGSSRRDDGAINSLYVLYFTSQQTVYPGGVVNNTFFVTPGYTLFLYVNSAWSSYVGRLTSHGVYATPTSYYFTKQ